MQIKFCMTYIRNNLQLTYYINCYKYRLRRTTFTCINKAALMKSNKNRKNLFNMEIYIRNETCTDIN